MSCLSSPGLITQAREFEKGFELKNSSSLLDLPISSSAETWRIFGHMQCHFAFALAVVFPLELVYHGGTQRGYSSKPLKHSIAKRILLFKR